MCNGTQIIDKIKQLGAFFFAVTINCNFFGQLRNIKVGHGLVVVDNMCHRGNIEQNKICGYNWLVEDNHNRFIKLRWYFSKAARFSQLGGMFYGYEKEESAGSRARTF